MADELLEFPQPKNQHIFNALARENFYYHYDNSQAHYRWEHRIWRTESIFNHAYNPEKIVGFLRLLCSSFGVPVPRIRAYLLTHSGGAWTDPLLGEIALSRRALTPICVIHEFMHWYGRHKHGNFVTHNQLWAKKLQRRLVWKTKKYWESMMIGA